MARLLTGKEVAEAILCRSRERMEKLAGAGIVPSLAVIRCGSDPADMSYEKQILKKAEAAGVKAEVFILPEDVSREALEGVIVELNQNESIHGVLLFRPLPGHLKPYEREICNHLLPDKDIDCMTDLSNAGVYEGRSLGFPPCTPEACMRILDFYGIDPEGMNAVVIGRSLVVGKPAAAMLLGKNATVTVCHTRTRDLKRITKDADLVVLTAGVAGMVTAEYVRSGQIVLDVSVNWDPAARGGQGAMVGDAAWEEVSPVVDAITPVPGGVGTVTTSVLIEHVISAAEGRSGF